MTMHHVFAAFVGIDGITLAHLFTGSSTILSVVAFSSCSALLLAIGSVKEDIHVIYTLFL